MSPRNDDALAKKLISLKLHSENGTLCLYLVERYTYFDPSAPPNAIAFFEVKNDAIDYLNMVMAMFCKLKQKSIQPPNMLAQYDHTYSQRRIKDEPPHHQDGSFPHYPHQRNELFLRLPSDHKKLLLLLGTLDNFLKHSQAHAKDDGYVISFVFNGEPINPNNMVVSNRICRWLHSVIGRNSKLGTDYKQTYEMLCDMRVIEGSLTPHIQEILFPDAEPFTIMRVNIQDPWALNILNPETSIAAKTRYILEWLRYKLSKKSKDGRDKVLDAGIHAEIHTAFDKLKTYQTMAWNLMIDTLYGKEADDHGFFSDDFYEIGLLRKAKLELTEEFKFILNFEGFLQSKAYKRHYQSAKEDVLKREIIKTCGLMGLTFEPDQDFHTGKARFTSDATLKLMRLGFHWSEPLAKKMLQKFSTVSRGARIFSIVYSQFNHNAESGKALPANLLPEILKMNEPVILEETIAAMVKPM